MKKALILFALMTGVSFVVAQLPPDVRTPTGMFAPGYKLQPGETFDVNYTADIRGGLNVKWFTRLTEANDFKLQGFRGGLGYSIPTPGGKLNFSYDLWRGENLNAKTGTLATLSYGMASSNTTLGLSLTMLDTGIGQESWYGRLDFHSKF